MSKQNKEYDIILSFGKFGSVEDGEFDLILSVDGKLYKTDTEIASLSRDQLKDIFNMSHFMCMATYEMIADDDEVTRLKEQLGL